VLMITRPTGLLCTRELKLRWPWARPAKGAA